MSVRVGTLAIDDGAQVFYAKDQQFFSRAGIDVDIRPMPNGPEIAAAAAAGDIDVGFSNLFALAAAFTRGAQLRLIAPGQLFSAGRQSLAIIVRMDSPYRTGKDLNGKKIGVRVANSLVGVGAKAWVDQHGGDSNTIQLVHLPGERHAEALEQEKWMPSAPRSPMYRSRRMGRSGSSVVRLTRSRLASSVPGGTQRPIGSRHISTSLAGTRSLLCWRASGQMRIQPSPAKS
jgi:hypothetical protein